MHTSLLYGDMSYWLIIIVSLVLGGLTQAYIKRTYARWSAVPASSGQTGAEVARRMLDDWLHEKNAGRCAEAD